MTDDDRRAVQREFWLRRLAVIGRGALPLLPVEANELVTFIREFVPENPARGRSGDDADMTENDSESLRAGDRHWRDEARHWRDEATRLHHKAQRAELSLDRERVLVWLAVDLMTGDGDRIETGVRFLRAHLAEPVAQVPPPADPGLEVNRLRAAVHLAVVALTRTEQTLENRRAALELLRSVAEPLDPLDRDVRR